MCKIYIYRDILNEFSAFQAEARDKNIFGLSSHLRWFDDLSQTLFQYETDNPNEADFFYIPICSILFEFLDADISPLISKLEFLSRGKHILFVSGDYSHRQRGSQESIWPGRKYPNIYNWLDSKFILIALESTPSLLPSDIAIFPYQDQEIQFSSSFSNSNPFDLSICNPECNKYNSDLLYSFCGALSYGDHLVSGHIRGIGGISSHVRVGKDYFIGSLQDAINVFGGDVSHHAIMRSSTFTLCPAGYGRWTFRWIEALLCNSIPIIMSNDYILPFREYIDWAKYVIILNESDLESIDAILREIDLSKIRSMQLDIAQDKHLFTKQHCQKLIISELTKLM